MTPLRLGCPPECVSTRTVLRILLERRLRLLCVELLSPRMPFTVVLPR
jgi:hypothetical protein